MRKLLYLTWSFSALLFLSPSALAWGERGHDIVTRVAVLQLAGESDANQKLNRPFSRSPHKLAHLSNVPDIVWRSNTVSHAERSLNAPTHYFDVDLLHEAPVQLADLEYSFDTANTLAKSRGHTLVKDVGTAPWRVLQLHQLMTDALRQAGEAKKRKALIAHVDTALLYGGLMSHFVGDLANPHHTTVDFDGRATGNGGLHAYFESGVVSVLSLNLDDQVWDRARRGILPTRLKAFTTKAERKRVLNDPEQLVFALVVDSFSELPTLLALDNRHSLIKRSKGKGRAKRKPAAEVTSHYEDFIVQRLAMGASVLSQLWYLAWLEAGQPDLSSYQSFQYPVQPAFIRPDYCCR